MTDKRIIDLNETITPSSDDYIVLFDVSDDTQSTQGSTKKMSLLNLYNQSSFFGWAQYTDTQYTEVAPLSFNANVKQQLPNNAGSTINTYLNEIQELWDNDKITPVAVGDAYSVRVGFKCKSGTGEQSVTLTLDIGDGVTPNEIYGSTQRLVKGNDTVTQMSFVAPIFALNEFMANGGKFYLESNAIMELWEISVFITKTFRSIQS